MLSGRTIYRHYLIEVIWVDGCLRGWGLGRRLMEQAAVKAKECSCFGDQIGTLSFQGPEFYSRLGLKVIGKIEGFPAGHDRYFLLKIYEWYAPVMKTKADSGREHPKRASSRYRELRSPTQEIAHLIGAVDGLPPELSSRKKHYLGLTGYSRRRPPTIS